MQAVVKKKKKSQSLNQLDEKAATPNNVTVLLLAWVNVHLGYFHLVKAVVTLFSHHQVVFLWLSECTHLLTWPQPSWSVAIIVVRKQMWVHTLERKSVCDCGRVRLHGMAVCECFCVRVCRVWAGGFSEIMTWHFLHPVPAPDYGKNAQPCLAILYSTTHTNTHRPSMKGMVVHMSIHVWLRDDLGKLWSNPESWVGSGCIQFGIWSASWSQEKTHAHKIKYEEALALVHRQSNAIWCEVTQSIKKHTHSKFGGTTIKGYIR